MKHGAFKIICGAKKRRIKFGREVYQWKEMKGTWCEDGFCFLWIGKLEELAVGIGCKQRIWKLAIC